MKTITFLRKSSPEKPGLGYGDCVEVKQDDTALFASHASTCPNPYKTIADNKTINWRACYALIKSCETNFECVDHSKFGKCLLINNGLELPTINPNRNHDGNYIATEIFVHVGNPGFENPNWRGSKGCFTLHRDYWTNFIACFEVGEKGTLVLKDFLNNNQGV